MPYTEPLFVLIKRAELIQFCIVEYFVILSVLSISSDIISIGYMWVMSIGDVASVRN